MSEKKKNYESIPLISQNDAEGTTAATATATNSSGTRRSGGIDKRALVAEIFGTATLVQIGCGANCVSTYLDDGMVGMWQIGAVWTLGAMIGIYSSAAQSGGHINPAVTLAFALVRRDDFSLGQVIPYWVAQLIGAMIGAFINNILFTTAISNYEEELKGDSLLESATPFGDYWRYVSLVADIVFSSVSRFWVLTGKPCVI